MNNAQINLSDIISSDECYGVEPPQNWFQMVSFSIQKRLNMGVPCIDKYDDQTREYQMTERVHLAPALMSPDGDEVYVYKHRFYYADHSPLADEPSIGQPYWGTIHSGIAVMIDGVEVGREHNLDAIVEMATEAIHKTHETDLKHPRD